MKTVLRKVHPEKPERRIIAEAAQVIRRGGLVAFPTETVYGLGANALDEAAVRRVFEVKGRPPEDPLIVHVPNLAMVSYVAAYVPDAVYQLAQRFWPGPLTVVLPRLHLLSPLVTGGGDTVAVRIPAHPVALGLLRAADTPLVAPSANLFGHTSPTTAEHVLADLEGRIEMILDAGPTPIGVESTVLDLTRTPPVILRPGGITPEALQAVLGTVELLERSPKGPLRSPGLLERHYAPRKPLELLIGSQERILEHLRQQLRTSPLRLGLLLASEDVAHLPQWEPHVVEVVGSVSDLSEVARNLYAALRRLDRSPAERLIARDFGCKGLGLAIRDRLRRAADRVIRLD
ncbi:MAG: L-threonylcarbamoyladenylate synthase [Bacteroidota bacterium]|nr:L-threonylcarbamoyladenylate synthase [Bacteroidota bacterium]MDW8138510.1 L-threonylcarbamoyladenylate synthase [Bacteroidota bacterium]